MNHICYAQFGDGNPLDCTTEAFKSLARASTAHGHTTVIIEKATPAHSKKMVVLWPDRNNTKSTLNISFGQKTTNPGLCYQPNSIINASITDTSMLRRNEVINGRTIRVGQMLYQAIFPRGLFGTTPKGEMRKDGKGGWEKGPARRWADNSLSIYLSTTSGCCWADNKLEAVVSILGPS